MESLDGDYRDSPLLRRLADVLLTRQAVQRPTLARQTGLSLQVIADLLAELESRGLVVVNGRFNGIPGRSNLSYALAAGAAAALAAQVCDSWIEVALCDLRGAVLTTERAPLDPDGAALDEQFAAVIRLACARAGIERFRLGAAHIHIEAGDGDQLAGLATQLGCPVILDSTVGRTQAERLNLARRDLLDQLFGSID